MNRIELSDGEWLRLLPIVKKLPRIHVGLADTCRRFISAALWILRSGAQWRVLPAAHGKWNSVFRGGAPRAPGRNCWFILLNPLIYKMCPWMAQ
ncbi:MAG: transposase [Methylococcales bacterium]